VRLTDLLALPLAALWQQRIRSLLTTLGVVFGAFVLAASLSVGQGVQETIERESRRIDIARRVGVSPKANVPAIGPHSAEMKVEGTMTDARRERLRKWLAGLEEQSKSDRGYTQLTRDRLNKVAAIPHVERVIPVARFEAFAVLGGKSEGVWASSARPDDEDCRRRLVAGRFFDGPHERAVVLGEFLAYRLGLVNETDVAALIGKPIRVETRTRDSRTGLLVYLWKERGMVDRDEQAVLDKVTARLPGALKKLDLTEAEAEVLRKAMTGRANARTEVFADVYTVVGVVRSPTDEESRGPYDPLRVDYELILPYETALDVFFRSRSNTEDGANLAVLYVDSERNVKDVVEEVHKLGLEASAAIELIDRERLIYLLIFGGMTCVAGIALLISALGIANTMLILQR
jgi:putative ABC transport system permease protein